MNHDEKATTARPYPLEKSGEPPLCFVPAISGTTAKKQRLPLRQHLMNQPRVP